jgi:hypothetical protein
VEEAQHRGEHDGGWRREKINCQKKDLLFDSKLFSFFFDFKTIW